MKKCYLLAQLDHEQKVIGVLTSGEPPWTMTKDMRTDYLIVYVGTGESYSDALDEVRDTYPAFSPRLAARFPFPG